MTTPQQQYTTSTAAAVSVYIPVTVYSTAQSGRTTVYSSTHVINLLLPDAKGVRSRHYNCLRTAAHVHAAGVHKQNAPTLGLVQIFLRLEPQIFPRLSSLSTFSVRGLSPCGFEKHRHAGFALSQSRCVCIR